MRISASNFPVENGKWISTMKEEWKKRINCFELSSKKRWQPAAIFCSHNHKFKLMQISPLLHQLCLCYFFMIIFARMWFFFSPFSTPSIDRPGAFEITKFHFHLVNRWKATEIPLLCVRGCNPTNKYRIKNTEMAIGFPLLCKIPI